MIYFSNVVQVWRINVWIVTCWKPRHHKRQNVPSMCVQVQDRDKPNCDQKMCDKLINLWKKHLFFIHWQNITVWLKKGKRARKCLFRRSAHGRPSSWYSDWLSWKKEIKKSIVTVLDLTVLYCWDNATGKCWRMYHRPTSTLCGLCQPNSH